MMICPECKKKANTRFCPDCGTRMVKSDDLYDNIEKALLSQNYIDDEDDFTPDDEFFEKYKNKTAKSKQEQISETQVFNGSGRSGAAGRSTRVLSGSTTMYMDAIEDLDDTDHAKGAKNYGKLDKVRNMDTASDTDFLGETDFLGYTSYLNGDTSTLRSQRDPDASYEESEGADDSPLANVFGLKKKPKKVSRMSGSSSGYSSGRNSRGSSGGSGAGRKAVRVAGNSAKKTTSFFGKLVQFIGNLFFLILRLGSAILMALVGAIMFYRFWNQKDTLGNILTVVNEQNYALASYLVIAMILVLIAFVQFIRILSARRRIDHGRPEDTDHGQGLFTFLFFLLLCVLSGLFLTLIPSMDALDGVRLIFQIMGALGTNFLVLNVAGIILCITRKVRGMF